jgi:tetratricopeptide (TPR) repeat protein/TolB-like protein
MVDPAAISTGSDFGPRYRIEALLGQGGMGRVYKAYDKELNRTVAIKVILRSAMGEADALNRFKQELVLASKISHKNILRIHDLGEVDGVKFITMAYVEGQDLHQVIRANGKLPLERVLKFATQLAGALAAAHAEDVVHRDLKPQNILLDTNDQVYVSDFGLAKSFAAGAVGMTQTGALLGTPRYMSPEQVEGRATDGRSDLYAYGLILYEMVTGDVPFTGESALQVMYQRIQEKPKNPKLVDPSLPDWLARIIMRCLEKDPADRYQNAYEILGDLQGGQSGSGAAGVVRRGSAVEAQIPEFANRRSVLIGGGVILALFLTLAIPRVRHLIFRGAGERNGSTISGVPPLSSGRFVAVLPLQVLGDPTQLGYIAQGIEETLSAKLFELKDVRVAPGSATDKADQKQPLAKIAGALGSNILVHGMLQGAGDKIRVTMSLEDVVNGKRLWTKEFDGMPADLLTIEDHIYDQLVVALNVNPSNDEQANARIRPTENATAYDLYLRGRNSLRGHDDAQRIQAALDYFDQALKADAKFGLAYAGIADASLRMNRVKKDSFWPQKALAAGLQAEQLNDNLPEIHVALGSVYSATGKYSEAIAELNRAISLAPNSDEGYRRLGQAYLKSGNREQGIQAFQKAIQLNPYYWQNQNSLGNAYYELGEYSKAVQAFQQIIVLEPDMDVGYENIGNVYLQQGKYQECIPYLEKALQREPYFSTYSNLGTAYYGLKQYPKAVEMFEQAVALNPNDTQAVANLADAYGIAGQKDKARTTYQRSISLGFKELETNPQDADVMVQIALSYAQTGEFKRAEIFIGKARAINKNNVNYIYADASINAQAGREEQALRALQEAFEKHYPVAAAEADPDVNKLPGFSSLVNRYATTKAGLQ